jgi:hypothetical protein
VPSSQTPPEFFIDRSLGRHLLPDALRASGFVVHTMWDIYGPGAEQRIADVQWIAEGAAKGWILLSKDEKMRYRTIERTAIEETNARVFLLTNQQLPGQEQVGWFLNNMQRVVRLSRKLGPRIYGVYQSDVRLLWTAEDQTGPT